MIQCFSISSFFSDQVPFHNTFTVRVFDSTTSETALNYKCVGGLGIYIQRAVRYPVARQSVQMSPFDVLGRGFVSRCKTEKWVRLRKMTPEPDWVMSL